MLFVETFMIILAGRCLQADSLPDIIAKSHAAKAERDYHKGRDTTG